MSSSNFQGRGGAFEKGGDETVIMLFRESSLWNVS